MKLTEADTNEQMINSNIEKAIYFEKYQQAIDHYENALAALQEIFQR